MAKGMIGSLLFMLCFFYHITAQNTNSNEHPRFWIWLTYQENYNLDTVFNQISSAGLEGVLLNASPVKTAEILPFAKKYNLQIHAWKWILNTKNKTLFESNPAWASVNRLGISTLENPPYVEYYRFMCPGLPEVRNFVYSEIEEYLAIEDLSGISLDYCRYVDVILPEKLWNTYGIKQEKEYPEWDYGYHPEMIDKFENLYNYDPRESKNPSVDSLWVTFREQQVNEIAIEIANRTRVSNKIISASPFPTPTLARKHVRQDWASWELDFVFPMIYSSFYRDGGSLWFRKCLEECLAHGSLKGTTVFPGIYVPGHREEFNLSQVMNMIFQSGAKGFAVFSYSSLVAEEWEIILSFIEKHR